MNDHIKSEISAYLAGELPESRNRQIEAHAASCEKCRNALAKKRAKQARVKREALKKASPERSTNLFLARQGKLSGADVSVSRKPWVFAALLVLAGGGGYWGYQKKSVPAAHVLPPSAVPTPEPTPAPAIPAPAAPTPPRQPKAPEKPKPPLVLHVFQDWKGPECGILENRLVVVRNTETWQKLWEEMQSKDPMPPVDFSDKIVLGVFAGERPAGTSIVLGKIEEDDEVMMAPYRITLPAVQTSSVTAVAAPVAVSHPYLLAVVPRVDKKIRLTQKEKSL